MTIDSVLIDAMSDTSFKVLNNKHYHHARYSSVGGKLTNLNDGWWCYCVKIETIDIEKLGLENDDVDWDLVIEYLNQEISDKVFGKIKNADRIPW